MTKLTFGAELAKFEEVGRTSTGLTSPLPMEITF